tara:strand:- start:1961 stop:2257 length:297 start_codon:yes stop_codon:yes gene_type:complete
VPDVADVADVADVESLIGVQLLPVMVGWMGGIPSHTLLLFVTPSHVRSHALAHLDLLHEPFSPVQLEVEKFIVFEQESLPKFLTFSQFDESPLDLSNQ